MIRFGYVRPLADPDGKGLVTTKAKRFDRRRMWRTERGAILRPRDFEDEHLLNTVRYIRRLAFERGMANAKMMDSMSEASQDALGTEADGWFDPEKIYPILLPLCREIKRRGLQEKDPFEQKTITRPFSLTLHKNSQVPLLLRSDNFKMSPPHQFVSFHFVNMMKNDDSVCLDKTEVIDLRDTLTKILEGWR